MILRDLNFIKTTRFQAFLLFALTLATYLFTLAPTIGIEDSGEFATAAATLGVAHPPGFPLYVLLGKLFTFLPLGTVAGRVNLMSAFWGAATVAVFFVLVNRVIRHRGIAAAVALVLGWSELFWSQSVVAEVYTLNAFFVVLLMLLLVHWSASPTSRGLSWFFFLYGLSLTNHTMMALLMPAFGVFILITDPALLRRPRKIVRYVFFGLLGLTPYVWMAWRALHSPLLNALRSVTFASVLAHISRAEYNDFVPDTALYSKLGLVISFVAELGYQFFYPSLLLALVGFGYLLRRRLPLAILSLGILLGNSLAIIYLRKFGFGLGIEYTYKFYYLPSLAITLLWLAVAIWYGRRLALRMLAGSKRLAGLVRAGVAAMLVILPASFLVMNWRLVDLSRFWLGYDYADVILESLPPNAVYYFAYDGSLQGDTELFNLQYLRLVAGRRPDVRVVNEMSTFYKEVQLRLPRQHFLLPFEQRRAKFLELLAQAVPDRPLYTNFAVTQAGSEKKFFSRSNGIVYQIFPSLSAARSARVSAAPPALSNIDEFLDGHGYVENDLIAHLFYNLAAYYLTAGDSKKSAEYLAGAIQLANSPGPEHARFLEYRAEWLGRATTTPLVK